MPVTVEYEQIQGQPTNLAPMPLTAVVRLKEGDKVFLWWAKDGNIRDVRISEVCTVAYVDRVCTDTSRVVTTIGIGGGDIDIRDSEVKYGGDGNEVDWGGRGSVYFYYPPE